MTETREPFHHRVALLEQRVVAVGRSVRVAIDEATQAWLHLDAVRGAEIDDRRHAWANEAQAIEQAAYELIATQQPMASDLRRLVSLVRLSEEVARSGALVAHVARAAGFDRGRDAYDEAARRSVASMATIAGRLWDAALDAYEHRDAEAARRVASADDELDAAHEALFELLISGSMNAACAVDLALIGRFLERLGDHAVDIAARADFVATGAIPRPS